MDLRELTECPYYLISRATLVITAALRRDLEAVGAGQVRPAYLGVLMSLWQEDGLRGVELCRRAGLEPSSMTGLLDRMERDGLVARTADPADRRAHRISLTVEGRRLQKRVDRVVERTLEAVLSGVREPDLGRLKKSLKQILANAKRLDDTR